MPEEEGFSEVGAVVSLAGLDETLSGMERYNAGVEGMAQETGKQAAQISTHWDKVAEDTRKSIDGTVTAVEKGEAVFGEMPASYKRMQSELATMGERASVADEQVDSLHATVAEGAAVTAAAGGSLTTYMMVIGGVIAVAGGAMAAVSAMYGALERVEPLWAARDAFAALGEQVGLTTGTIIRDTQRASRFTVSEYGIITNANKDLLAGNEALADSYSSLMELAYVVSRSTGKGVEEQFNAIAAAVRSGNQAALEAADVWIDVETAQLAYAQTQDRTLEQLSEEERQLIALQVVLAEIPGYIDRMGGAMDSALTPIRSFTTAIKEATDAALALGGLALAGVFERLFGEDPGAILQGWQEGWATQTDVLRLLDQIKGKEAELGTEMVSYARQLIGEANRRKRTYEDVRTELQKILGIEEKTPDPYAGISAHERRVLSPEELDARVAAMQRAEEAATRMEKEQIEAREKLRREAKGYVIGLAPYLTDAQLEQLYQRYIALGEQVIDQNEDIYGRPAQQEMSRFKKEMSDLAAELKKVERGGAAAAKELKETQLGAGPIGGWAADFATEHGGKSPFEVYQKHEEPLVAATMDRLFGEKVMRETGRPPTQEDYIANWYKVHGPFEAFKGGPITGQRGPEYEEAKAFLAGQDIEEIGKAWHTEWMARKGVVTSLEELKTQEGLLATFLADTGIPARENEVTAVEAITEKTGDLGKAMDSVLSMLEAHLNKPPPGSEGDGEDDEGEALPPVPLDLALEAGRLKTRPRPTRELLYLPIPTATSIPIEPHQFGTITTRPQIAQLHENEAVIPFGSPGVAAAILSQMLGRMGGNVGPPGQMGGGGVSIGQINVPVTVSGNVTKQTAAMLQSTIIEGIRHRAGAAIRREARRLGS